MKLLNKYIEKKYCKCGHWFRWCLNYSDRLAWECNGCGRRKEVLKVNLAHIKPIAKEA